MCQKKCLRGMSLILKRSLEIALRTDTFEDKHNRTLVDNKSMRY